uniref:FGF n=1 Tax=Varanus komodoensis TaxID=61221 RepID=A0A8D2JA69_VARKO
KRRRALQEGGQSWRPASGRSIRSYPHLRGDVRWRRLYSPNHFFLSIDDNGKVKGTYQRENTNSVVDIRSVHRGTVAIRSIHSGFYVAMNRKGRPELQIQGTHRRKWLQHVCLIALAPPGPPHVPLAGRPGRSPARDQDTTPTPFYAFPAPACHLSKGLPPTLDCFLP